ncbi:hypothetical protein RND81_11G185200 [Saponaria officinalis]|uniref:Retrotransposon gag domain-containing protein n=1 Tax=Saponaria officinalis TaxID=3572 RepID=A0AAW1HPU9_SAPOF
MEKLVENESGALREQKGLHQLMYGQIGPHISQNSVCCTPLVSVQIKIYSYGKLSPVEKTNGEQNVISSARESYEISQNGRSVEEYFTQLQIVWDELDSMNVLPQITKITTEVAEYLTAVDNQEKERKLFQFLNGLDKEYGILRSNILIMDLLPSVDQAVSLMLQEEMQTSNLGGMKNQEAAALLGKGETEKERCSHCGRDNHRSEHCWEFRGYLVGHPRHKKSNFKPNFKGAQAGVYRQQKPYQTNSRQQGYKRSAATVKAEQTDLSAAIGAATQQLENLLKMVPNSNISRPGGESEEELECNFAGLF